MNFTAVMSTTYFRSGKPGYCYWGWEEGATATSSVWKERSERCPVKAEDGVMIECYSLGLMV